MSYHDMLGEVRKHQAGDKIQLVISRESRKDRYRNRIGEDNRNSASRSLTRSDFTGTLGGQAANLQDTAGRRRTRIRRRLPVRRRRRFLEANQFTQSATDVLQQHPG